MDLVRPGRDTCNLVARLVQNLLTVVRHTMSSNSFSAAVFFGLQYKIHNAFSMQVIMGCFRQLQAAEDNLLHRHGNGDMGH
jgi:hypothetical protein